MVAQWLAKHGRFPAGGGWIPRPAPPPQKVFNENQVPRGGRLCLKNIKIYTLFLFKYLLFLVKNKLMSNKYLKTEGVERFMSISTTVRHETFHLFILIFPLVLSHSVVVLLSKKSYC
jgi:hypothetical protein